MRVTTSLQIVTLALLSVPAGAAPTPLPRGEEIQVSTVRAAHARPSVAAFQDGGFVVGWTSEHDFRVRFLDSRGRPTSGEISLKMGGVIGGTLDQVVADRDGSFLAVVTGYAPGRLRFDVFVRRFNRNGTPRGQLFRANTPARPDRDTAVAAIGADGRIAVAWRSTVWLDGGATTTHAVARIFSARGNPLTKEIVLHAPGALVRSVAFAPGGTLSALVQAREQGCMRSYLVRRTPGGSLGRQRLVPTCAEPRITAASLAMGLDGSLVSTWSGAEILARRFSPQGIPRGEAFPVSEEPAENQLDPGVALQAGGSFVVAWIEANGQDGEGQEIFGRAFAPNGTPRTGNFPINTTTEGARYYPAIAAARQGNVLVVWLQQTGLETGVVARLLSADPAAQ